MNTQDCPLGVSDAMNDPADNPTVQHALEHLNWIIDETAASLRSQGAVLRQQGMSLPPGALDSLQDVRRDLDALAGQVAGEIVERDQLRALAETAGLVTSSLDINQVLNKVMDTVITLTGAQRGYIVLREPATGEMAFRVARNLERETIDEGEFIVSRSIVSQVAQTGEAVIATNAQTDPDFSGHASVMIHGLRSILCVPLVVRGTITGVVYVDNRIRDGLFGETHRSLLMAFANQAAVAIENARLYQSVQDTLAEMTEIKELMDNVFSSITSGVITTDTDQIVTTYNLAAERILNAPGLTVLGQPLGRVLPVIYAYIHDLLPEVVQHGHEHTIEIDPTVPGRGRTHLRLKITPFRNQDAIEGITLVLDDLTEIRQRDATLDVARRYLPPTMLDHIQSLDGLGLGGERREITILFVEVRPFNRFPPALAPHEMTDHLNLHLTVGADAIHKFAGLIDKFMGNEIMGLFNTQLNPDPYHAWNAVQAGLMLADEFARLLADLGEEPIPYHTIGIHTGIATVGNVGSQTRREFTAIGDSVNLAKRLQENAQPGQIIISGDTRQHCEPRLSDPASGIQLIELPSVQVKGRRQATTVYEIRRAQPVRER